MREIILKPELSPKRAWMNGPAKLLEAGSITRIVVKEEKSGASRTIKISARAAAELKAGDRVRIKLKAGTDESAGVRVLKGESSPEPKVEAASEPAKK